MKLFLYFKFVEIIIKNININLMNFQLIKKYVINRYILLFIFVLIVYLKTIAPDIIPEDSGELVTASFSLGVPHPPGYPLFVLLSKLFIWLIPYKSIIFRVNLFSAFFSALTCVFLFKFIYNLNKNNFLALILSLTFAFSRIVWSQSIISKVYTLNLFLITVYLFFVFKAIDNKKYISFIAFLSGLLYVSHFSNVLIILPVVIIFFNKYKNELLKIIYVIWGVFPLTLYLLLIIRAQVNPLINWGNPSTISTLLFHILRLSFGSVVSMNPRSLSLFVEQIKVFKDIYFLQFNIMIGCLFLILLYFSLKKFKTENRNLLILLLLFTSIGVVLVLNFQIDEEMFFVNKVFFMPFALILIISLALIPVKNKLSQLLLFFIPLLLLFQNYSYNDRSRENYTQIYNMDVLKSITYNSILFSAKDFSTFPLLYYQKVEYLRPDITIYDWFGNVFTDIFNMKDFHLIPEFKRDNMREQITDKIRLETDKNAYYTFQRDTLDKIKSFGIVYSYNKALPDFNLNYFDFPVLQTKNLNQLDYFVKNMISVYYFHLGFYYKQQKDLILSDKYFQISNGFGGNKAKQYVNLALNELRNKNFNSAISYLQSAINSDDKLDQAYFILGNIYFQQNNLAEAETMYQKAIQINALNGPAFNTLAELYLKQRNEFKAKEIYQQGLTTGYSKLFNGLAILLIKENNISEAVDYLKKGINITPDDFSLYLNLSVALSKINHWTESGQYLEKAYRLNPDDKNVILNFALVNIKLNNFNRAKALLNEGKRKYPEEKAFDLYLREVFNQ